MSKELSPETVSRIEREAEEKFPTEKGWNVMDTSNISRAAYLSAATIYEGRLEEKEIEIADLKSALQAEEFAHQLSKNRINNLMNPF